MTRTIADARLDALLSAVKAPDDPMEGFNRLLALESAASSVALSHPAGHDCIACRAAHGDGDALIECAREAYRDAFPRNQQREDA